MRKTIVLTNPDLILELLHNYQLGVAMSKLHYKYQQKEGRISLPTFTKLIKEEAQNGN